MPPDSVYVFLFFYFYVYKIYWKLASTGRNAPLAFISRLNLPSTPIPNLELTGIINPIPTPANRFVLETPES